MSESNTPRLMAAAKEFNIGKDTLVDFLVSKGFSKDDLKPTSKLTEDMYHSLQQEFSSDKAAKAKSDAIEIPKGAATEAKKKKDEEEDDEEEDLVNTLRESTETLPYRGGEAWQIDSAERNQKKKHPKKATL